MGREVVCSGIFNGWASEGKALLEIDHVLWRGAGSARPQGKRASERVRFDFQKLGSVDVEDGSLVLEGAEGSLLLRLGSPEAERWAQAILNPKTIVDKMGLVDGLRVSVLGVTDSDFLALLGKVECDVSSRTRKNSDVIVVQVNGAPDLSKLDRLEPFITRSGMIWVVSPKGQRTFNENHVYDHMRALGLKDVKTARFSDSHTANKFVIPKERR